MLASQKVVKELLKGMIPWESHSWHINTVADKSMRTVGYCIRQSAKVADEVAMKLATKLNELGYDNEVIRTTMFHNEYIRTRVIFDGSR